MTRSKIPSAPARGALAVLAAIALTTWTGEVAHAAPTPPKPKSSAPEEGAVTASTGDRDRDASPGIVRAEAESHYRKGFEEVEKAKKALEKGKAEDAKKKFGKALGKFEYATELDPNYYQAWNMVGYCARQQGDLKRAFAAYAKCLSLEPEYAEAHEYLGEAYVMSGEIAKAKEQLAWLRSRDSKEAEELAARIDAATRPSGTEAAGDSASGGAKTP